MKKFISYKLIGLGLIMAGIAGCDTADQDVSPTVSPDSYPVATFTQIKGGTTTAAEGDTLIFKVEIDEKIERSITFSARVIGGDASADDIEVTSGVIAPYTYETTVQVVLIKDWVADENESMKLEFGAFSIADRYQPNPTTVNPVLDLTVSNYISGILTITCDWDKNVDVYDIVQKKIVMGTYTTYLPDTVKVTKDLASYMDWDMLVLNTATGKVVNTTGATGDHPEVVSLKGLVDGSYLILNDLWVNKLNDTTSTSEFYYFPDPNELVPISANFKIQGTDYNLDIVNDPSQQSKVSKEGYDEDEIGFTGIVAQVNVSGGKFTIIEFNDTETGPWKNSAIRESILNLRREK